MYVTHVELSRVISWRLFILCGFIQKFFFGERGGDKLNSCV